MIRIFVAALAPGELAITGDEHHYLSRVRRARAGDALELVAGGRRAIAHIARIAADATIAEVGPIAEGAAATPVVRALVPLIKGDRMDLCLEKLVEVGVSGVIVWAADRSVVKLDPKKLDARVAHYAAVAEAAARQSGSAAPGVAYAPSLDAALAGLPPGARLVLDPRAERGTVPAGDDVTIASGPEGGFAPAELDRLASAGFAPFGLGPRVLRAETAPILAVALVRATTGS